MKAYANFLCPKIGSGLWYTSLKFVYIGAK